MSSQSEPGHGRPGPGLSAIISERRQLINLAYRLLGSLAEAEDAVRETYVRWYALSAQEREAIERPGAWLTTVASRICLDLLGSARVRRERYVGEWLPEPLPDPTEWVSGRPGGTGVDVADRVALDESVSMAFLIVLESMTPAERVAFILHDVFGYPFAEVAQILDRTPAASRKLASSARRRIRASRAPAAPAAHQASIVRAFRRAWEARDIEALIALLDPGATATGDGGGLVRAELRPVEGAGQIARYLAGIADRPGLAFLECTVTASPAWWPRWTAPPQRCTRSTSQATRSSTSGPYSTPTSSGPGRQAGPHRHRTGPLDRGHSTYLPGAGFTAHGEAPRAPAREVAPLSRRPR